MLLTSKCIEVQGCRKPWQNYSFCMKRSSKLRSGHRIILNVREACGGSSTPNPLRLPPDRAHAPKHLWHCWVVIAAAPPLLERAFFCSLWWKSEPVVLQEYIGLECLSCILGQTNMLLKTEIVCIGLFCDHASVRMSTQK